MVQLQMGEEGGRRVGGRGVGRGVAGGGSIGKQTNTDVVVEEKAASAFIHSEETQMHTRINRDCSVMFYYIITRTNIHEWHDALR